MSDNGKFLPYGADYAKTGRSNCKAKGCENTLISQDDLRICARHPSPYHDGLMETWFHFECFWLRSRQGLTEAEIYGFEHLKWDDQELIRVRMAQRDAAPNVKGTINAKAQYAPTGRSKCNKCSEFIEGRTMRIQFNSSNYHPECLAEKNVYFKKGEEIDGFENLKDDDQETLRTLFPGKTGPEADKAESISIAKSIDKMTLKDLKQARDSIPNGPDLDQLNELIKHKEAMKKQCDLIWKVRDEIEDAINSDNSLRSQKAKRDFVHNLIADNNGYAPPSLTFKDSMIFLADIVVFGAFAECPSCSSPNFFYNNDRRRYQCNGDPKGKTCSYVTRNPKRKPFNASNFDDLDEYDGKQLLPEGRVYSKTVEEGAENERLVSLETPKKKVDLSSRKRKNESAGTLKENGYTVDSHVKQADLYHVYVEGDDPHQFLLHKLSDNNSGDQKFYKMQLLEKDGNDGGNWLLFRRYGFVLSESKPADQTDKYEDFDSAIKEFEKIFREKTGYAWNKRHEDLKVLPDKYKLTEWNLNMTGTYGRSTAECQGEEGTSSPKKVKEEELDQNNPELKVKAIIDKMKKTAKNVKEENQSDVEVKPAKEKNKTAAAKKVKEEDQSDVEVKHVASKKKAATVKKVNEEDQSDVEIKPAASKKKTATKKVKEEVDDNEAVLTRKSKRIAEKKTAK